MPYELEPAANPLHITERQFATAQTVQFSPFTSCLGLLGRNGNAVTAVHLVMNAGGQNGLIDLATANLAIQAIGQHQEILVVGQVRMWQEQAHAVYQHLLNGLPGAVPVGLGDGVYAGRVNGADFQYAHNNHWSTVY